VLQAVCSALFLPLHSYLCMAYRCRGETSAKTISNGISRDLSMMLASLLEEFGGAWPCVEGLRAMHESTSVVWGAIK